jgi:hypothetical protein
MKQKSAPGKAPAEQVLKDIRRQTCRKGRYAPPVYMIRLTAERAVALTKWFHPSEEDR